ncbi:MAG: hypothetical protein PUC88_04035 [Clostridia bacterium]|nr:hypothetical protein [Clostridia bacterium]
MKKVILLIVAASMLALPMSACGNGDNSGSTGNGITIDENVSKATIVTDKSEYSIGDSIKCDVMLPKGNSSVCKLVAVPSYLALSDIAHIESDASFVKAEISASESVEIVTDTKWRAGDYDLRLVSDGNTVAVYSFSVNDNNGKYGTPQAVIYKNNYVTTDPANVYISDLRVSVERSSQMAQSEKLSYEVIMRVDGVEWSAPWKLPEKYVSYDKETKRDLLTILPMRKAQHGISSLRNNERIEDILPLFEEILETTVPSPGNNGIPYIDTTKHTVEVSVRYAVDGEETVFTTPCNIGMQFGVDDLGVN